MPRISIFVFIRPVCPLKKKSPFPSLVEVMSVLDRLLEGDRNYIEMTIEFDTEDVVKLLKIAAIGAVSVVAVRALFHLYNALEDGDARRQLAEIAAALGLITRRVPATLSCPESRYPLRLHSKRSLNHNVVRFRFELTRPDHILGPAPGQHTTLSAVVNGKRVARPYSPVSGDDLKGYVDLVIKRYDHDNALSKHIHGMAVGDSIDFSGPRGSIVFKGRGAFETGRGDKKMQRKFQKISMVAGGSGLTPMVRVIRSSLEDNADCSQLHLLFANRTQDDIFLREELDAWAELHSSRFGVSYSISQTPVAPWNGLMGRPDSRSLLERLHLPSADHAILLCGPNPMVSAVKKGLIDIGHSDSNILVF